METRTTETENSLMSWIERAGQYLGSHAFMRRALILLWNTTGLVVTYWLAYLLRFDGHVPAGTRILFLDTIPLLLVVYLGVLASFRHFSGMWTYFSVDDLARMGLALVLATLAFAGLSAVVVSPIYKESVPRSVFVLEFLLMGLWMAGAKFAVRYLKQNSGLWFGGKSAGCERILIIGKAEDADLLIRAKRACGMGHIVGIVTSELSELGASLHGVRILGVVDQVAKIAQQRKADCILILPPFNRPRQINQIVAQCADQGLACTFRTIPSLVDLASGELTVSSIRQVSIEDLLSREQADFDRTEVRKFIKRKKVMITGAGGSIGSELSRQIAKYEPSLIVLFESSEYALYTIDRDLRLRHPNLQIIACAGDIRHPEEVDAAIRKAGGIDVIYHAAAYKHVPLMEENVCACFRTNVLGTARLVESAIRNRVDRFVMISSDKAVNPSSIMGATKRIAERIIGECGNMDTTFVSVRFGNVLGSSGSVIPLFKQQIAKGGPVTVTSPEVERYFMTIPEAVDLVLMAGTVGNHGDVMVLEMGESIKVVELARRLIELSGLVPGRDIEIKFVGLRPGEKEFEEVMTEDENVVKTPYERICVFRRSEGLQPAPAIDLKEVERCVVENDDVTLRTLASRYVPDNMLTDGSLKNRS